MAPALAESAEHPDGDGKEEANDKVDGSFDCNICLETARNAVVSVCGHLFCWSCLHQWLEARPDTQMCPVCNAAISKDKVIPLYGRSSTRQEESRKEEPPRPVGQRTEPEMGVPFTAFLVSTFNFGNDSPNLTPRGTRQHIEQSILPKLFLWCAVMFIAWLILR